MEAVLVAINAKYFHTGLAVRQLLACCNKHAGRLHLLEATINQPEEDILWEITQHKPRVVGFSCYIWNITLVCSLMDSIKKILPQTLVVLGGPEASFAAESLLAQGADVVVRGEGEVPFPMLLDAVLDGDGRLAGIPGISYVDASTEKVVVHHDQATPACLDDLPFPYTAALEGVANKILYYETSRGCPFACSYCMSGRREPVRLLSQEKCQEAFAFFLAHRVKQVKLVDRTFNANKAHAMGIWQYLIDHDNGVTNFHFELAGDLLDEDMLDLLQKARPGLFQFEIGIQSTHQPTLAAIGRKTNIAKLFHRIQAVASLGNIHQHVDLIAGLPLEGLEDFKKSFNDVYALSAQQLQLGFLKLLHGSPLRQQAEEYGIVYRKNPPYDVLYTQHLPYTALMALKAVEQMLELYYNGEKCRAALAFGVPRFSSPFDFYAQLAAFWAEQGLEGPQNKMKLYEVMGAFLSRALPEHVPVVRELMVFDMRWEDRVPNMPAWATEGRKPLSEAEKWRVRQWLRAYPGNEQNGLSRQLHMERFQYDIAGWLQKPSQPLPLIEAENWVLFDYTRRESREIIYTKLEESL